MQRAVTKDAEFAGMLRLNPLFRDLDQGLIEMLARLCYVRKVSARATLFQKGDPGDALYGIRRGQISIETGTEGGQRNVLAILGMGQVFGEIALLDGGGRSADAIALEPTHLFALRRTDLLATISREPIVGVKLIEVLCKRLRGLTTHVEEYLTLNIEARLAQKLAALAADLGKDIAITQEQLARYIGATRESVNRQLRLWQSAGLVEVRRGRILVKDSRGLQTVVRV